MPPPEFASVTRAAPGADEEAARVLRRRLRWGAILLVEITVLMAVIYAALP